MKKNHTFRTSWEILIKFSGKMCPVIILNVTENQGFTLSLENAVFKKPQKESQFDLPRYSFF